MNNGFDKKAFEKSMRLWTISYICIAVIGIASVILSFFVGNGWGLFGITNEDREYQEFLDKITPDEDDDFGEDPKNYYGTYYGEKDFFIYKLDISEENIVFTVSDPYELKSETMLYQYGSAEYSNETFGKENATLIVYDGYLSNLQSVLYLTTDSQGKISIGSESGVLFTDSKIEFEELMNSPDDYFGTYYGSKNYAIEKIEIGKSDITFTTSSVIVKEKQVKYKYMFLCADYAEQKYQKKNDLIVVYEENITDAVRLLWLDKDENGKYILSGNNEVEYGTKEITFNKLVNDPQNYYGTYVYSANNKVTVNSDGTAAFTLEGKTTSYKYFYADNAWLSAFVQKNYKGAIVLHNNDENALQIFEIDTNGNLVYGDAYTFVKN